MPQYTLYPTTPTGLASTFEAGDFVNDAHAAKRALELLDMHRSCDAVVVWRDQLRLATYRRADPKVT